MLTSTERNLPSEKIYQEIMFLMIPTYSDQREKNESLHSLTLYVLMASKESFTFGEVMSW